jgi:hypothetical protein
MDNTEAISPTEEARSPVTTDSMVTVPLSDRHSTSNEPSCDSRTLDIPETPIEEKAEGEGRMEGDGEELDGTPKSDNTSRISPEPEERRESASSTQSQRARNSHDPVSPAESDGVDWEKLDKTEEQEPRNEATDEVRLPNSSVLRISLMDRAHSLLRCCSLAWSKRTMPWQQTRNRA